VTLLHEVTDRRLPVARLEPVIGPDRYDRLIAEGNRLREDLGRRTVWNISSVAVGGGVAEMLQVLGGYVAGFGIPMRWTVIGADPAFFVITKKLHNEIHGRGGEPVTDADARYYEQVLAANADELLAQVSPGDVAILHDPQTAGLVPALTKAGVRVAWRCHIGIDQQNDVSRSAWEFLRAYLTPADAFVFTRRQYAPSWMADEKLWIIPPSIDPFSAKNADLDAQAVRAMLTTIGLYDADGSSAPGTFTRVDGTVGEVTRPGLVIAEGKPAYPDPLVVQVSRWDSLKDMAGVMTGFTEHVLPRQDAYLVLAGPAVAGVADDPEGAMVLEQCRAQWQDLPPALRSRVLLVALPLDDFEENATMVNALQRKATVIVQKSLAEGFGLTVAEGMWKGRPVIGSAVGGIVDQIADGTGILLADPTDLTAFGQAVSWLLDHPQEAELMGQHGRAYTREHFIGDRHLLQFANVIDSMISG
jgi:trehalose synthase